MLNTVVVKALFGDYDNWIDPDPNLINKDWDYHLFTDQDITSDIYTVHKTLHHPKIERKIKIMPWNYLRGYDRYIWIDANIHPIQLELDINTEADILLLEHPARDCVYDELKACVRLHKDDPRIMTDQVAEYYSQGYPPNNGMVQTGFMVRKPTDEIIYFSEDWYFEVENKSRRDQLSFNYIAWKYSEKLNYETIPMDTFNQYYTITKHK